MSEEDFRVHFPENKSLFSFYTLKKVLKVFFALLLAAFFLLMALRSCTSAGSAEMKAYLWTEAALAASAKDDFKVYSVPVTNEMTVTSTFAISHIYYTEPLGQFQFLLSYNLSKLEEWGKIYSPGELPETGEELFAFALVDDMGRRYTEYAYVTDQQLVNGFYRLVFDGIPLTYPTIVGTGTGEEAETDAMTAKVPLESLTLCVYYAGDVDFEGEKIDEITIYRYGTYKEPITPKVPDTPRTDLLTAKTEESAHARKESEETT